MMTGLKPTFKTFKNIAKVKGFDNVPYIIYWLDKIHNLIEDVHSVSTVAEIQEAIDSIGTGAGTIFIASGTYTISTPIDIDGCGSLIIYGHGDNTILQADDGINIFNITCCQTLVIRTLKLDINNYTADTQAVIVNETNNNIVGFSDISIDGAGANGIGVELQSNNCYIDQCNITDCKKGIYINNSNNHTITNNTITGHADYGIHGDTSNYLTITTNMVDSNGNYGIYLDTITYSNISGNMCNSNSKTGIYCGSSTNNTISNNSCSSNSWNGIYITGSSYNTISGNALNNNDSNTAIAQAGLYITTNCDYNTISGNTVNNNNNVGVGTGYGIYIATATCEENVVASNNANGNDIDYMDSGTATTIEYYVQSTDELQDAIDSIGDKAGIINIDASFTVATTIDIDGNGSYIIQGEGSNSTLTTSGDIKCFNIDVARQVILKNFKIDASSLTTATKEIIDVNEDSNNIITLDNIVIVGDGTNGYGIELNSNNCRLENCNISSVNIGINILADKNILRGNTTNSNASYGIQLSSANTNNLTTNIVNSNGIGIYISSSDYITVSGNTVNGNTEHGIELTGSSYANINGNSVIGNDSNQIGYTAGIKINTSSNNNIVIGNSILDNNNLHGAGGTIGYGIYIGTTNCNDNIVKSNNVSGNDVQWFDYGNNSDFEYICSTGQEIQDAIDSIYDKAGTIKIIAGTVALTATIDIDHGGYIIIEGVGDGTIIDTGDRNGFDIIDAKSGTTLRNFKMDTSDFTLQNRIGIYARESHGNSIYIENLTITGDTDRWGYAIFVEADNSVIRNCRVSYHYAGILSYDSDYVHVSNNISTYNRLWGIDIAAANYNVVNGNVCINNGISHACSSAGIVLDTAHNNIIINNICNNNTNAGAGDGYGILILGGISMCNDTIISANNLTGNDVAYLDSGTRTILYGDDTVYAAAWNGNVGTPTKNAVYDKIETLPTTLDGAFDGGKIIDGANSETNAVSMGGAVANDKIKVWHDGSDGYIKAITDDLIVGAEDLVKIDDDRATTATIASMIYTGTYQGTGGANQTVAVPFQPKFVQWFEDTNNRTYWKIDNTPATWDIFKPDGAAHLPNCVIFTSSGFSCNNGDASLNLNGVDYYFVAMG